jgi:hypothetical protein
MNIRRCALLLVLFPVALAAGERFAFAALGCLPYGEGSFEDFERVLAEIDRHHPAFALHLGDIKGGGERPTIEHYTLVRAAFDAMETPLIYTPGDNEWTDVIRESNGSQNQIEWLDRIRAMFFEKEESRGRHPLPLVTQRRDPQFAKFVENARWERGGVVFATVHAVGSWNNNQPNVAGAVEEFEQRDAANAAWIRATFAEAREKSAPGVVLCFQVDPFAADFGREGYTLGMENFLRTIETEARAFAKPVLLLHADDHNYHLTERLAFTKGGEPAPNVTRLGAFGDKSRHAVMVVVDPANPVLFLCGPLLVPGNALPAITQ